MAYPAQPKDSNNIPIGSPYVPNDTFRPLKGSTNSNTDGSGNVSTAAAMALEQSLPVSAQLQNAQTTNANGSTLSMYGMGGVLFEVTMTGFTGTVNFEGATPNGNYDPLWCNQLGTNTIATTATGSTTTSTHLYELANSSGLQTIRARTSSVSAGNVTVSAFALPLTAGARVVNVNIVSTGTLAVADIEQSGYVSASTPPTQTNAGSDTSYTFSSQVNRVIIENNTSANVNFAFDAAASAGSLVLTPGSMLVYPKKCTVLHLFTAAAQNINGTTAGNIVVLGAL